MRSSFVLLVLVLITLAPTTITAEEPARSLDAEVLFEPTDSIDGSCESPDPAVSPTPIFASTGSYACYNPGQGCPWSCPAGTLCGAPAAPFGSGCCIGGGFSCVPSSSCTFLVSQCKYRCTG